MYLCAVNNTLPIIMRRQQKVDHENAVPELYQLQFGTIGKAARFSSYLILETGLMLSTLFILSCFYLFIQ